MKSKDLIRRLQEADPSGEVEVCVGNVDIHFVSNEPAYYDGALQVLERDPAKEPYYSIVGGKYVRTGRKIQVHTLSISDAVSNDASRYGPERPPEFHVDYSELSEKQAEGTRKAHDDLRQWHTKLGMELERQYFVAWVKAEAERLTADTDVAERYAKTFFEEHVSCSDPLPEGGVLHGMSYVSTREQQWRERFEVVVEDGIVDIRVRAVKGSTA